MAGDQRNALFDLSGKTALVTGAGRGLGRQIALTLAAAGATVLATDIDENSARETADLLGDATRLPAQSLDVTDPESIRRAVDFAVAQSGRLDILVNNAGINVGNDTPAEDLPPAIWRQVLEVNLTGPYLCSHEAARHMIPAARGKIINIASVAGVIIPRLSGRYPTAYSTSKAGVIMLTRTLGLQWARYGISVNAISPTYTDTDFIQRDPVRLSQMIASSPFERLGTASDLAGAVIYLASAASDFTTGENMIVDGGYSL